MTTGMDSNTWFRRYSATATPRRRLVLLSPAGGSASFFHVWRPCFRRRYGNPGGEVPGRHERLADPCVYSMAVPADQVTAELLPLADIAMTLFGHSMGASPAYEVALRLEEWPAVRPAALHVSSRKAPHRLTPRNLHQKGNAALRRLGGTDTVPLGDPDFPELVMPAVDA